MRLAIAILALLLASHVSAEPDSNELTLDAPANDVAMAGEGDFFGVGIDDPKDSVFTGTDRDLPTWFLHEAEPPFATQQAEGADPAECSETIPQSEDCDSDVTFVAMNHAGDRMVAASQASSTLVVVVFIAEEEGSIGRVEVSGVIRGLAMDDSGTRIVAAFEDPSLSGTPEHQVILWEEDGTEIWNKELAGAPNDIDISPDGQRVIVAAGNSVQVFNRFGSGPHLTDSWGTREVVAVAFSARDDHMAVAANDQGAIRLYADESGTPTRQLNVPGGQVAATAIGFAPDGTQMAIAIGPSLRIWEIAQGPVKFEAILLEESAGASIRSLQYGDGYLLAGTARTVLMYNTTVPVQLWKATLPSDIVAASMDDAGDRLAVAFGSKVRIYEMVDEATLALTGTTSAGPGQQHILTLDIANTGDRLLAGDIVVDVPAGVVVDTDESVSVLPGKSKKVTIRLDIPGTWPAGELVVGASVQGHEAQKTLQVAAREAWSLSADGATSKAVTGGSATFQIKVHNDGNVAGEPPLQTTASPSGWSIDLSAIGNVAAGGEETLEVTLTAPSGAANLARGTATVGLPGQLPIELVGTVGAEFRPGLELPAQSRIEAGKETEVQATLRNAGNTIDSFDLAITGVPSGWTVTFSDGSTEQTVRDLQAGGTRTLSLLVQAPADLTPVTYGTTLEAISHGDRAASVSDQFAFELEENEKESPGLGIVVLLAIALAFTWRRRP